MHIDISHIDTIKINDLIKTKLQCSCNRTHYIDMDKVIIEENAIDKLSHTLIEFGYKKALILSDKITWDIAAKKVANNLSINNFPFDKCILSDRIHPDEMQIIHILTILNSDVDIIIAVGSGVICDMAKFIAAKLRINVAAVITAPSVDGFASRHAAIILNNLKVSFNAICPKIIIGDVNILKNAPMPMILAGWCDIIGKYSALTDWQLGKIINNEYYCDVINGLVNKSVEICKNNLDDILCKKPQAITYLMEGLILTGIAMGLLGNSRPASGSEHHLSHCWEMKSLEKNWKLPPHGIQVGVGELIITQLYDKIKNIYIDFENLNNKPFNYNVWKNNLIDYFHKASNNLLKEIERDKRYTEEKILDRLYSIRNNWSQLQLTISKMPSYKEMLEMMDRANIPTTPTLWGLTTKDYYESIIMAKEVRDKYTILRLLDDLDLLEIYAKDITTIKEQDNA